MAVFLAVLPIIVIAYLLLGRKLSADISGCIGYAVAVILAFTYFNTAPNVILSSSLAGIISSLPVAFVLLASLFQITVMQRSGALARVIVFIKALTPGQLAVQLLLMNMGLGILFTALGAASITLLPPVLMAMGYTASASILLPAFGYTSMGIYALLGIPAVVFAAFVNISVPEAGWFFAKYMPLMNLVVALLILYIGGGLKLLRQGIIPAFLVAAAGGGTALLLAQLEMVTLTGIFAGIAMIAVLLLYTKLRGLTIYAPEQLSEADQEIASNFSLLRALSPWIVLTIFSLLINTPALPFFELTFVTLKMPIHIIPGSPELLRLFWQAYFWVFVSTILCLPIIKIDMDNFKQSVNIFVQRGWRVFISTAVFFCIAYVMNHSGKDAAWNLITVHDNMISVMSQAVVSSFGQLYPLAAPLLGLIGGFISGSQTSTIAMFTKLNLITATALQVSGVLMATACAMGGGLAGVISPAKIQAAAASIDRPEEAVKVMPKAFALGITASIICGCLSWFF